MTQVLSVVDREEQTNLEYKQNRFDIFLAR